MGFSAKGMNDSTVSHSRAYCIWKHVFVSLPFIIVRIDVLVHISIMCLLDSCYKTVKEVNKQTGAVAVFSLTFTLYDWLQSPSPIVQSHWMAICWSRTHQQLSSVFEVKQHPWLGAKSVFLRRLLLLLFFKAVGTSVRETHSGPGFTQMPH